MYEEIMAEYLSYDENYKTNRSKLNIPQVKEIGRLNITKYISLRSKWQIST